MPIYQYKCSKCKKEFEKIVKDRNEIVICECESFCERLIPDTFRFRLKGKGWAKDGYQKDKK